ncbi:MAG: DUF364 domain-containing protein [Candidatus Electryonea clarkiae]|nr:DUF364 domain-containing protein [Candidatus Electryonea clarkiae]
MKITERITETLAPFVLSRFVSDIRIGVRYVAVQLDDGSIGVAYVFPDSKHCKNISIFDGGDIVGKRASELLRWLSTNNTLARSVGLATVNAIAGLRQKNALSGDVRSGVEFVSGERVAMIGYFEPLVKDIRNKCELNIYELNTSLAKGLIESSKAEEGLKNCDIALITSTAIINGTVETLLEAATDCREVVILGPSTPLVAAAFEGTAVTMLSGVTIVDDQVLRVVSEGGGMKRFKPYVQKFNIKLNKAEEPALK